MPPNLVNIAYPMSFALELIERVGHSGGSLGDPSSMLGDPAHVLTELVPGTVVVLPDSPRSGTTDLFLRTVHREATKLKRAVALFSLQIPTEEVLLRLLALGSGVPLLTLKTGKLSDSQRESLWRGAQQLVESSICIDDSLDFAVEASLAALREKAQRGSIRTVFIDGLREQPSQREVDALKSTALALGFLVLLAISQNEHHA